MVLVCSWDSMGCESGIVGEEDEEAPAAPVPTPSQILYAANSQQLLLKTLPPTTSPPTAPTHATHEGAFRPVPQRRGAMEPATNALAAQLRHSARLDSTGASATSDGLSSDGSLSSSALSAAAAAAPAKRRWDSGTASNSNSAASMEPNSPLAQGAPTDFSALLAEPELWRPGRKTPLRLLIAPPGHPLSPGSSPDVDEAEEAPARGLLSPRKKSRPAVAALPSDSPPSSPPSPLPLNSRPSLNFDKMREVRQPLSPPHATY